MSSIHPEPAPEYRQLVEAWRADTASVGELRRGYARFVRRRTAAPSWVRLLGRVALGLLLGVGLAQAASLVESSWVGRRELRAPPPSPRKSGVSVPAPSASSAVVAPESSSPAPAPMPSSAARDVGGGVVARPSASPPAGFVHEQWQLAAAALRDHDFVRAETAFIEIERSVGGVEGDAARLARAQLLASYGRRAEALTLAGDLEEHARSPLVRAKARALFGQMSKIDDQHRSTAPAPAINQP